MRPSYDNIKPPTAKRPSSSRHGIRPATPVTPLRMAHDCRGRWLLPGLVDDAFHPVCGPGAQCRRSGLGLLTRLARHLPPRFGLSTRAPVYTDCLAIPSNNGKNSSEHLGGPSRIAEEAIPPAERDITAQASRVLGCCNRTGQHQIGPLPLWPAPSLLSLNAICWRLGGMSR